MKNATRESAYRLRMEWLLTAQNGRGQEEEFITRRREQMQIEAGDRIGFPPPPVKMETAYWKRDDSISSYFRVNRRVRSRKTLVAWIKRDSCYASSRGKPITRNRILLSNRRIILSSYFRFDRLPFSIGIITNA